MQMMKQTDQSRKSIYRGIKVILIIVCVTLIGYESGAQPFPPHPIAVYSYPEQGLQFGAFTQGVLGGTVTVSPSGFRTVTGDVIQLSLGHTFSAAFFEVEGEPGTRVQIVKGPDVILTSNTGGTLSLHLGDTDPASPFIINVTPPSRMQVRLGGTLTVGNPLLNPPGTYNGTFIVTFIQE